MKITATVENSRGRHAVIVATNGQEKPIVIPPKPDGLGSSVNGGELLLLALATCYCNDVYREARKQNTEISAVRVQVTGEFGGEGEGAKSISYRASVDGNAPKPDLIRLLQHTDSVAEIQNTVRWSAPVLLESCEVNQNPPLESCE